MGIYDHADTNKLQEHLDKYSLEVKKVNRIYVRFSKHVKNKEIEHTINLLKNESNVIKASPDLVMG
jgi:pyruvate-formate lyase-activating enzyme